MLRDVATDDLLAMRALLVKYSADQPRNAEGEWTSGDGETTRWTDGYSLARDRSLTISTSDPEIGSGVHLYVDQNGRRIGTVEYSPVRDFTSGRGVTVPHHYDVDHIAVAPEAQGRGLATAMLSYLRSTLGTETVFEHGSFYGDDGARFGKHMAEAYPSWNRMWLNNPSGLREYWTPGNPIPSDSGTFEPMQSAPPDDVLSGKPYTGKIVEPTLTKSGQGLDKYGMVLRGGAQRRSPEKSDKDYSQHSWDDSAQRFRTTLRPSTKAARTVRLSSGGTRRDASLNPITDKVRASLITLAAAHKDQPSPIALTDKAQALLYSAYLAAYRTGYTDSGADPVAWDDDAATATADSRSGAIAGFLLGLGAALMTGAISSAMLDARLGSYSASLNPVYERGFGGGVATQGEILRTTWQTEKDETVCDLCEARDGKMWWGADPPIYPGDGTFGEYCEGAQNCRCSLLFELTPLPAAVDAEPEDEDIAALATGTLLKIRAFLAKSNPYHDERGRFASASGGGTSARDAAIHTAESEIMGLKDHEEVRVIGSDGRVILSKNGEASAVGFTNSEMAQMVGATVTHNHPSGVSISPQDLALASRLNLASIRAVGTNYMGETNVYEASRQADHWPPAARLLDTTKIDGEVDAILFPRIIEARDGGDQDALARAIDYVTSVHQDMVNERMAARLGFTYTKTTWQP